MSKFALLLVLITSELLLLTNGIINDFRIGIQLCDGVPCENKGQKRYTKYFGETVNEFSIWAGDSNYYKPNGMKIGISGRYNDNYPSEFLFEDTDIKFCIKLTDETKTTKEQGNSQYEGQEQCTPWASAGGGWSPWAGDADFKRFDAAQVRIKTQYVEGLAISDIKVGIKLTDDGTNEQYVGIEQYSDWITNSAESKTFSKFATDSDLVSPDAVKIYAEFKHPTLPPTTSHPTGPTHAPTYAPITPQFDAEDPSEFNHQTLTCLEGQPCSIVCDETDACEKSKIICPPDDRCYLTCHGLGPCTRVEVTWPETPGLGHISCEGIGACHEANFPEPDPNTALTIECSRQGECWGASIYCPKNAPCHIKCAADPDCQTDWPFGPSCEAPDACEEAVIYCPDDALCDIQCTADNACKNAVIHWSQTRNLGTLSCDGSDACYGIKANAFDANIISEFDGKTLQCLSNEPCHILCDKDRACNQATIKCPANNECNVQCIGTDACRAATITWPTTPGLGNIICDVHGSCIGVEFPRPVADTPFTIECDDEKGCGGAIIYCPDNANCEIQCTSDWACSETVIHCPDNANCDIKCTADYACHDATITWPTTPGLGNIICNGSWGSCMGVEFPRPVAGTPFTIECDDHGECCDAIIHCPDNANCEIQCTAAGACDDATIKWPTTPGLGNIICNGYGSCAGVEFPRPVAGTPLTIECDDGWECGDAIIYCPDNANCDIKCTADYACGDGAVIYCPEDANCEIQCTGINACRDAVIHWSETPELGHISCEGRDACKGITHIGDYDAKSVMEHDDVKEIFLNDNGNSKHILAMYILIFLVVTILILMCVIMYIKITKKNAYDAVNIKEDDSDEEEIQVD